MSGSKNEADKFVVTPGAHDGAADSLAETKPLLPRSSLSPLLQRYDLLQELGHGGMGVVYLARDRETNDTVALKVLKDGIAADPAVIEAFKAELLLARKITHPNVCRVYELLRFDGLVAIAMEHIDGESLRSLLRRVDGLSVRQGLKIAREICAALAGAHAQGVIHRDLKPENILIARDGTLKVLDFGIARPVGSKDPTGIISGTPAYMAPEQLDGKPADQRSDIYALGLVLYEVFTGRRAFTHERGSALATSRSRTLPMPPSSVDPFVPEFVSDAIMKCVEIAGAQRFQSVAEFLDALDRKAPAPLPPEEIPGHLVRGGRTDQWLTAAAALGLASFLAFAPIAIPDAAFNIRASHRIVADEALGELSRRGSTGASISALWITFAGEAFSFLAASGQTADAFSCLNTYCQPYYVRFTVDLERAPNRFNWAELHFAGGWRSFSFPVDLVPRTTAEPPHDEALGTAQRDLLSLARTDVTGWKLERDVPLTYEGRRGFGFSWVEDTDSGLKRTAVASVYGKTTYLSSGSRLPPNYRAPSRLYDRNIVIVAMGLVFLCLFVAKRIYLGVEAKELLMLGVLGFAIGLAFGVRNLEFNPPSSLVYVVLNYSGPALFLFLVVMPTVSAQTQRRWSPVSMSMLSLLRLRPARISVALAVYRGCVCGLVLLGAYAAVLAMGTFFGLITPRLTNYSYQLDSPVPSLNILARTLLIALGMGSLLVFVVSLLRRFSARNWLLVLGGGAVWLPMLSSVTLHPLPPEPFAVMLTMACATAFCAILLSFDFLTLCVSILTVALFMQGYAFIGMFKELGNGQFWMLFVLWTAAAAWGAFVGFQPLWARTGRRIAEAFE